MIALTKPGIMQSIRKIGVRVAVICGVVLAAACALIEEPIRSARDAGIPPSPVVPTALVMAGLQAERRGDTTAAFHEYQRALEAARTLYGTEHPNVAFAHAALGIWHACFGGVDEALFHLRQSRRIDEGQGRVFINIAETRLPAEASDPVARALIRLRLQRDLVLCALDGGCSPARVLALGEALGEASR